MYIAACIFLCGVAHRLVTAFILFADSLVTCPFIGDDASSAVNVKQPSKSTLRANMTDKRTDTINRQRLLDPQRPWRSMTQQSGTAIFESQLSKQVYTPLSLSIR
jgi:hypothetical protein